MQSCITRYSADIWLPVGLDSLSRCHEITIHCFPSRLTASALCPPGVGVACWLIGEATLKLLILYIHDTWPPPQPCPPPAPPVFTHRVVAPSSPPPVCSCSWYSLQALHWVSSHFPTHPPLPAPSQPLPPASTITLTSPSSVSEPPHPRRCLNPLHPPPLLSSSPPPALSAFGWHVMVALVCSLPLPLFLLTDADPTGACPH